MLLGLRLEHTQFSGFVNFCIKKDVYNG
jgi:hypothetical protein